MKPEFTEDHIKAIEEAILRLALSDKGDNWTDADLIAALTEPEWKPEVGQVVLNKADARELWRPKSVEHKVFSNWRALNQREVGPDWTLVKDTVPREACRKLLSLVKHEVLPALAKGGFNVSLRKDLQEILASIPEEYRKS